MKHTYNCLYESYICANYVFEVILNNCFKIVYADSAKGTYEYLSLVEKEELTKEEEKEFKLLKLKNQYAMTLEEAKKRV